MPQPKLPEKPQGDCLTSELHMPPCPRIARPYNGILPPVTKNTGPGACCPAQNSLEPTGHHGCPPGCDVAVGHHSMQLCSPKPVAGHPTWGNLLHPVPAKHSGLGHQFSCVQWEKGYPGHHEYCGALAPPPDH